MGALLCFKRYPGCVFIYSFCCVVVRYHILKVYVSSYLSIYEYIVFYIFIHTVSVWVQGYLYCKLTELVCHAGI